MQAKKQPMAMPINRAPKYSVFTFAIILAGSLVPGGRLAVTGMVGVAVADTGVPAMVVVTLLHFDFVQHYIRNKRRREYHKYEWKVKQAFWQVRY